MPSDTDGSHHHHHHRRKTVVAFSSFSSKTPFETHENDEDENDGNVRANAGSFVEEDETLDFACKNWAVTRPRESAEETDNHNHHHHRTPTPTDEEEEEEEEETAPFSWEDIVRRP